MERQFPKNVKQVGNVSDTPKIYVEDYVDTYFHQLREQRGEALAGAFLLGEHAVIGEQECVFVTGVVEMRDLAGESRELSIGQEHLEMARAESRDSFHGQGVIGWMLIVPGGPDSPDPDMVRIHEKLFPEKNSLFILNHTKEEEQFFAYKFQELMRIGGHYIYYEKNPDMQVYMLNERKQIGVTPSEVVEDRAAKNFRNTHRGRMEIREQKRESRSVYLTSVLLVVVVLAIGISTMNNYDKINSVQDSIETLSSAMQQSEESGVQEGSPVETKDTALYAEGEASPEEGTSTDTGDASGDNPEDGTSESDETLQTAAQMEPETSTIQEELSGDDYYIVRKGDTLDTISRKFYGTTRETDAICRMNGLEDGNLIFIGQKLLLP